MDRCTGHCCRQFSLPYSAEAIKERKSFFPDGEKIADMIIPLGKGKNGQFYYTCRHFDKNTNNCKIYDERPTMCSGYPNIPFINNKSTGYNVDTKCKYADCSFDAVRAYPHLKLTVIQG